MPVSYPFVFAFTKEIEEFFKLNRIFLAHHNIVAGIFRYGETVRIDSPVVCEPEATMSRRSLMNVSAFSYVNSNLGQKTRIGRYCSISWGCSIMGIEHPTDRISTHVFTFRPYWTNAAREAFGRAPAPTPFRAELPPAEIGHDVWIGQDVLIRAGVRIGTGAVVAAGAVVTKDIPPYAIAGGVPAKVIKYRFADQPELRERMMRLSWWQYHVSDFHDLDTADPAAFLDGLEAKIAEGLQPYTPSPINLAEAIAQIQAPPA